MNDYVSVMMSVVPYSFGVGFILYICLSLLGYGMNKAISLFNS